MVTTLVPAYFDVEGILRTYINTLTDTLVGPGNPLTLGAHLHRLRSPARGCYAILTTVGTPAGLDEEGTIGAARISASIYSATSRENAAKAAVAYANMLNAMTITSPVVGGGDTFADTFTDTFAQGGVRLLQVDAITGPLYVPDTDEQRYLVDCDLYLASV